VTLVCLHGFTGSPSSWNRVTSRWPPGEVLCPALVGHDRGAPLPETFDAEVERLTRLLPPGPIDLAGYSMGARVALCLALAYPERIGTLTLLGVHPGLGSDRERAARREADARFRRLLATGIAPFVEAWEAQPLFASTARLDPEVRAERRRARLAHDPKGLSHALATVGLAEMPDCSSKLPTFHRPVTLLAGELDEKFSQLAHEMGTLLPNARVCILPGAGHDLLLERSDLVAAELEQALKSTGTRGER
jgi:2-succinyl-6-hydroxy-2,4-cyclohexadiene-1-carboxylate synthase